ncbi:MAG TPA: hypothetical protein PLP27_08120, partial [Crocinitomicaceae bacterium]|nr:hypothetical protein [Crocinitomicaceae bacterium]
MKKLLLKTTFITLFGFIPLGLFGQGQQPFFSETWLRTGGEMAMFYKSATTTDNLNNVYVVGATFNTTSSPLTHDIIIQKFNSFGTLLWQKTFDGNAGLDDMASDVFVDNNYNVYVTGASTDNANNDLDLVVLKYDQYGTFQWTYYYSNGNSASTKDAGTAIIGDNSGGIYVTGFSFGATSMSDYVT